MSTVEELVAHSTSIADKFVKKYYSALDSLDSQRAQAVLPFYLPTARIAWNGNPIPFADLHPFLDRLPKSDHQVQAFDCHPIAGSAAEGPPALVVSVTGQVTHGGQSHPPPGTIPQTNSTSKRFDNLPRVYSQTFILVFSPSPPPLSTSAPIPPTSSNDLQYLISADSYRFV